MKRRSGNSFACTFVMLIPVIFMRGTEGVIKDGQQPVEFKRLVSDMRILMQESTENRMDIGFLKTTLAEKQLELSRVREEQRRQRKEIDLLQENWRRDRAELDELKLRLGRNGVGKGSPAETVEQRRDPGSVSSSASRRVDRLENRLNDFKTKASLHLQNLRATLTDGKRWRMKFAPNESRCCALKRNLTQQVWTNVEKINHLGSNVSRNDQGTRDLWEVATSLKNIVDEQEKSLANLRENLTSLCRATRCVEGLPDRPSPAKEGGDETRCPVRKEYRFVSKLHLCYKHHSAPRNRQEAIQACKQEGGHLLRIDTAEKNNFMKNEAKKWKTDLHVDGSDEKKEGEWQWSNGKSLTFFDWGTSEPNGAKTQNCIFLYRPLSFAWIDGFCNFKDEFLCEIDV